MNWYNNVTHRLSKCPPGMAFGSLVDLTDHPLFCSCWNPTSFYLQNRIWKRSRKNDQALWKFQHLQLLVRLSCFSGSLLSSRVLLNVELRFLPSCMGVVLLRPLHCKVNFERHPLFRNIPVKSAGCSQSDSHCLATTSRLSAPCSTIENLRPVINKGVQMKSKK